MRNLSLVVLSLVLGCGSGEPLEARSAALVAADNPGLANGQVVRVMTRNLYLGADLGPAIGTTNVPALVHGAGIILRQVTATNFPVRAKGLAAEILAAQPDLVGLEEAALWRTAPLSFDVLATGPAATTVRFDYLQLLLDELNKDGPRYAPVVVQNEFDFEVPADEDDNDATGPYGADLNARLTMRDVILARVDAGIRVSAPQAGHYAHVLSLPVMGQPIAVTRGWLSVEARVRGAAPFKFVATHFEAFDPGQIRALQAAELAAGPAKSDLPVVLVGDLNSDDDTVFGNDRLAYSALLNAGFVERSTNNPLSCCVNSDDLTTGSSDEFDHQVDHIMTNAPSAVRLVDSGVTGRTMPASGWWDSDHAGVWSALLIRR